MTAESKLRLVMVWVILNVALPAAAEERLSLAYHGLRFLGLETAEEISFQEALQGALSQNKSLSLTSAAQEVTGICHRDIHCHCRNARDHKAARAVFGNIGRIGQIFTFELVLVETQSCAVENSVFVSETHDLPSARARLAALVDRLTTPLESLSETAVKDERDVGAVPAIVTVFTAKQIRQLGVKSIEELFQLVPGFESLDSNNGTRVLHLGLQGTILFLVDGIPLTNPMNNIASLSQDFNISLNHIERVEFVRGPGSVLWGPNAFLGIVNFITRMPTDTSARVTAQASYGTLGTGDFFAAVEQSHRWFRYHLSATLNMAKGAPVFVENSPFNGFPDFENPTWGNGGTTENTADLYHDLVAKLEIARRLQFLFKYLDHEDTYQISPFGSLLHSDSEGFWHKWHRLYSLAWEDSLPYGFKYRLSGSRYEYRFYENFVIHPPSPRGIPEGLRALQGNETEPLVNHLTEARLYHTHEGKAWTNQFLLGAAYLHQRVPNIYTDLIGVTVEPGTPSLDFEGKAFQTVAGFFQEDLSLWRWLLFSGGLRLEHRNPYGLTLSSQAALIARTSRFNTKLIFAEGFRPPEANQLYSQVGVQGNTALQPEKSRALSLEATLKLGPLRFKSGGTAAWVTDQIILDRTNVPPPFESKPVNQASTTIYAAYGEVGVEWAPLLSSFLNYNYKHLTESNPILDGIPVAPHTASLGISLRPLNDLSLFATGSMISDRTVLLLTPNAPRERRHIPFTFDMSFGVWLTNLFDRWDVGLKLHNPFGVAHDSPTSLNGNRNYYVERRRVSEVFVTVRWSSAVELGDLTPAPRASIPQSTPPSTPPAPATQPSIP